MRSRLDWKYALSLELTDPGFDHTVLSEFRSRLVSGNAEQRLLDLLLEGCREGGWLKTRGRQRTDSTHVLAKIRALNRVLCVAQTMVYVLNVLSEVATFLEETVVRGTQNRLVETQQPGIEGARAALETFYHGFNTHSLDLLRQNWLDDPLAQLDNPVGGIMRGTEPVNAVYARIFAGPVQLQVEFYDIVAYASSEIVVFAGRERGTYGRGGNAFPLDIRTTRIFAYAPAEGGWRQVHHHGSIDSAERLAHYQQTILGS